MYKLFLSKQALKDLKFLQRAGLAKKAVELKEMIRVNPFQNPPPYEKIIHDGEVVYSRRINVQHRLLYKVDKEERIVRILRMWTHYE
ncbi:MAG: Txe/YoeB family addiction module toxin [Kiritimatiellaeota bacterium]|nr:Txe/YoeB family addiction module toxin [Kiritimatiellota bacterium]